MKKTIIGVEYYRPPNPDIKDFKKDLENIKKAKIPLIRTWLYWQQVNPEEKKWDFSKYDRLCEIAEKNGIKVLIQLNIEVPPEWLIKKYPEARWVDNKGQPIIPSSCAMVQVGTYPGLTPDFFEVKKYAEEFLSQVVNHYKEHPALFGYDVWNEIMPFYGLKSVHSYFYHPETKKKFAKWLEKKYKKIDNLNQLYGGRNYKSFADVSMPDSGVYLEMLDLYEFTSDWILDYLNWKVKVVRRCDPKHLVVSHTAGGLEALLVQPFDVWELTKSLDIWGTSCYETCFWKACFQSAVTRDSSQGKPWGFVEMTGGRTWYGPYGGHLRTPEFLEQFVLLPLSYGGKFNLFWQWRPERFGQESPNFGLVNEDGSFNIRTERISRLAKTILKNQKLFDELKFLENDVGLLIDWRSFVLEEASGLNENFILLEYLGWFHALSKIGVNVEILYGSQVVKKGIPKNIKLLIAPLLNIERENMIPALEKFVDSGGHFLAGPYLFTYDSFTYMNQQVPPSTMQKIFGSRRIELLYPKDINLELIGSLPTIKISGHHCLEVYECKTAEPLFASGKLITGTKNIIGKSICYRVGSFIGYLLGKYICYPDDKGIEINMDNLAYFLKDIILSAGCLLQPLSSTGNVLLRLGESGKSRLLFVYNSEDYNQNIWLNLNIPMKEIRDLIQGTKLEIVNKNKIYISLQPRESKIIQLLR